MGCASVADTPAISTRGSVGAGHPRQRPDCVPKPRTTKVLGGGNDLTSRHASDERCQRPKDGLLADKRAIHRLLLKPMAASVSSTDGPGSNSGGGLPHTHQTTR
jgi:hypothetical protein